MTAIARTPARNIKGLAKAWGIWERIVPGQVLPGDHAGLRMLDLHMRRYQTAMRYVPGKRVLDIACGTGYGSKMMKEAGATSVTGVDLSSLAVDFARQHYQVEGVEFREGNAEEFEAMEQYDVVTSFETLEHLPRPELFLANCRKWLKPGGQLLLSAPIGETRHIDVYHLHTFSRQDIFNMLSEAGFTIQSCRSDDWRVTFRELGIWRRLYPESQIPFLQLFTWRTWRVARDILTKGHIALPMMMVSARRSDDLECDHALTLQHLT